MTWLRGDERAVTTLPESEPDQDATSPELPETPSSPKPPWRKLAIAVVLVVLVAGAGWQLLSGDGGGVTTTSSTTTLTRPTKSVPATVDPSRPPELQNTGEDFNAIVRSLEQFTRWVYQHDPDPKWTLMLMHPDCACFKESQDRLGALQAAGHHFDSEGEAVRKVIVRDRLDANQVTVYVIYEGLSAGVVDRDGTVIQKPTVVPPTGVSLELRRGPDGRWRTLQETYLGPPAQGWEKW